MKLRPANINPCENLSLQNLIPIQKIQNTENMISTITATTYAGCDMFQQIHKLSTDFTGKFHIFSDEVMLICKNFTHQLFLSLSKDFEKLRPFER